MGSLMRTRYYNYPEYHSSADNKDLICFHAMEKTVKVYLKICELIEQEDFYYNQRPFCEPQLGKLGLYPTVSSPLERASELEATMWLLNFSDGAHSVLDIVKKSGISHEIVLRVQQRLEKAGLLSLTPFTGEGSACQDGYDAFQLS